MKKFLCLFTALMLALLAFSPLASAKVETADDGIPITEVYVNGWGTPVEGVAGIDHMFLTTPDDAPYFIIYGGWRDETDQQQMWSEAHVFINGHEYTEGCQILAEEGYYFAEDCVFYADGGTDILDLQWCYVDESANNICYMNSLPVVCGAASVLKGDADLNGTVDGADALLALRYTMGLVQLNEEQLQAANVDGVDGVTTDDAILILRYVLELIEGFPA